MSLIGGLKALQDDLIMDWKRHKTLQKTPSIDESCSLASVRFAIEVGRRGEKGNNGLGAHHPRYWGSPIRNES